MALDDVAHQGKNGIVKIGAAPTVVALLTSWSYEESVDEYEKTAMTDAGADNQKVTPELSTKLVKIILITRCLQVSVILDKRF